MESLGLHGNWVTLFRFINARDLHYYDGIAMSFPSRWRGGVMMAYRQEGILRKHHRLRREYILLYFTCRSHDYGWTAAPQPVF